MFNLENTDFEDKIHSYCEWYPSRTRELSKESSNEVYDENNKACNVTVYERFPVSSLPQRPWQAEPTNWH